VDAAVRARLIIQPAVRFFAVFSQPTHIVVGSL